MVTLPALAIIVITGLVHAQELSVLPVQGNVYLISGAGGNIALQTGSLGAVAVDTDNGKMNDKVIAAINKLSEKPLQYIINTHYDPDFTGGNIGIRRAGVTITGANVTGDLAEFLHSHL